MKSFWANMYDAVKDRNYGILFFTTLLGLILGFLLVLLINGLMGGMMNRDTVQAYWRPVAVGACVFAAVMAAGTVRFRRRRSEKKTLAALSRDEIQKARSKLIRKR